MSWIRELKVGDQFLDSSETCIGTVRDITNFSISWSWEKYGKCFLMVNDGNLEKLEKNEQEWKKLTPLLKELL